MLFRSFEIIRKMQCVADPNKLRIVAKIEGDVCKIFPYLNRIREDAVLAPSQQSITLREGEKLITIYPTHITMTMIKDEKEANEILERIKHLINSTYENKDSIQPLYDTRESLKVADVLKYLPKTNCGRCGERTCFAFAYRFIRRETEIEKCVEIFDDKYDEKRRSLYEILRVHGYF